MMIAEQIKNQTTLSLASVKNTLQLLDEGCTIPFIARYRKEFTHGLNEEEIAQVKNLKEKIEYLNDRKSTILHSIEEQGKLSPELRQKIESCQGLAELEDLYLPYKPKRKTKATIARENGLEPLAKLIFAQQRTDVEEAAENHLNENISSVKEALTGAMHIISEWISEDALVRQKLRNLFQKKAVLYSRVAKTKEEEAVKYKDYFEFNEPVAKIPSHRILAIFRGEAEGFLRVILDPEKEEALEIIDKMVIKGRNETTPYIKEAGEDAYNRLIAPSLETELRSEMKEKADKESIHIFAENLRQILMYPPLGNKNILAIDPGYRTGCKVVCLDRTGQLLLNDVIYPHPPQEKKLESEQKLLRLVQEYKIEYIAVGNGTAGKETEIFAREILKKKGITDVKVMSVNESGASIYSASDIARQEFPNEDITVRGAVSIGRRLSDPLAELVKIDAKSIGVGQYQHDVNQVMLKNALDEVVVSCVNQVGVNLNTASAYLLKYVSGIGDTLAKNIIDYRNKNGAFTERKDLLKVARFGEKAYEQSAGFLRIEGGKNPLDNTAVHPEKYELVKKMAASMQVQVKELVNNEAIINKINPKEYITETTGMLTLQDILNELKKPGRDPRSEGDTLEFDAQVNSIEDLSPGMELTGIVTNITNFGAFVNIGVKQDGLVHISEMAYQFVKSPYDVVKLNQQVRVKVTEVDLVRKRIQLTMKIE